MNPYLRLLRLFAVAALGLFGLIAAPLASAAPTAIIPPAAATCVTHKHVEQWNTAAQVKAQGFYEDIIGTQASMTFDKEAQAHTLDLALASDPNNSSYTAARITEVISTDPIDARVKCWQPTSQANVTASYTVRFHQAATPPALTENLILWNAPLPYHDATHPAGEPAKPTTAFGVSRIQGMYVAAAAQDFVASPFSGFIKMMPMPSWLDASAWHTISMVVSTTRVRITVAQNGQTATVLDTALLHPPEPLAFEFSVDNETSVGITSPVTVADGLDVGPFDLALVNQ